jgi:hypothetical protein
MTTSVAVIVIRRVVVVETVVDDDGLGSGSYRRDWRLRRACAPVSRPRPRPSDDGGSLLGHKKRRATGFIVALGPRRALDIPNSGWRVPATDVDVQLVVVVVVAAHLAGGMRRSNKIQ